MPIDCEFKIEFGVWHLSDQVYVPDPEFDLNSQSFWTSVVRLSRKLYV